MVEVQDRLEAGVNQVLAQMAKAAGLVPGEVVLALANGSSKRVYRPNSEKQASFHALLGQVRYRLYGGAAGPGKTLALLMDALRVCHLRKGRDAGRGVSTLCLRRTAPQLEDSFLREFRKHVPRELYECYNEQKKIVSWRTGASTRFGSMQYDKDVWNYQGGEFCRVLWDELTQFTMKQWTTIKAWNRCPHEDMRDYVGMDGATNPIGVGAIFVKKLFVDRQPAPGMDPNEAAKYSPEDYRFVPATVTDNPVYANDIAYQASLDSLPHRLRAALKQGLWDVAIGSYFDIFDEAAQVVRMAEVPIENWWPLWASMDWGFEHDSAFHFHTTNPEGRHYTFGEIVVNHLEPAQLAQKLVDDSKALVWLTGGWHPIPSVFYLSPDAFHNRGTGSIAAQMTPVLRAAGWPTPVPAQDERVGGWQLLYGLLNRGWWKIGSDCRKLIEVLPLLPRDEDPNDEDIAKVAGDDPADAVRYGLYSKLGKKRPPLAERVQAQIEAMQEKAPTTDPTSIAIRAQKALDDQRKKGAPKRPFRGRFTWRPR